MDTANRNPHWSVSDGVRVIPTTPESVMAEINSAISSLESARSTILLQSPLPSHRSKKKNPDEPQLYDAKLADESYKAGLASLASGNFDEAVHSLTTSLLNCPPNNPSAVAKLHSLVSLASHQLRLSPK